MKIYYKKNFISGVFSLLLGMACGGLMVVRGFEIKLLVGLLLLLVLGGVDILWSLSRDSRASRGDALTLDGVVLAAFLLLLGTNLFYEKRM